MTDDKDFVASFEDKVKVNLAKYLQSMGMLDEIAPECPDVEEKWDSIARAYLPDGVREFQDYPVVSLGWMMFIGMAMGVYWDSDWARYSQIPDLYEQLRDKRGYDNLDEVIVEDVLKCTGESADKISSTVAECAARTLSLLQHEHIEPGTPTALSCYIACLHQLYLAGMAVELNALGYHMTPLYES